MLSENIKKLRMALGISQVELAKKLGVTKQCISNWENDNIQPSIEMLIKIAKYFAVPVDELLGLKPIKTISVDGIDDETIAHLRALVSALTNKNV
ncbi:MAG: helix-turn-helix transcriptional regulator [Ruminococcaceae bacterium]|nr:helix-turn-helix transcriptional regulator [Oscillospiraceae bacterium]